MTGHSSGCPDPEVLAAFVAGSLSGAELKMTADHLRECEDCRDIVGEIAYFDREVAQPAAEAKHQRVWPWWLAAAAAALAGLVYLTWWFPSAARSRGAVQLLVEATPHDGRYLEPRVTGGFPWAPLRNVHRGGEEPLNSGQMKLVGAAGKVLEQTARERSPEARHTGAIAHLLAGRPSEASELLAGIAGSTSDPRIWSDLAAARYAAAMKDDNPSQLAEALAAADSALRLDPKLPEALFNRALIIERLGLRDQARTAWEQYLAVDNGSEWAREARQHLHGIVPITEFRDELGRHYEQLTRDPAAARLLARQFPEDARVWGESEILFRWAEAAKRKDEAAAEGHLRVARAFGEEVLRGSGESLLHDAVAAIEHADAGRRRHLIDAHLRFRLAQRRYHEGEVAAAEKLFEEAAGGFARGNSPVALLAEYFVANTAFEQGRNKESRARLEPLALTAPSSYPAHRAQVEWELGLAEASVGRWGSAMHTLADSLATFDRLGESRHATAVRDILAEVYDRIGDRRAAWDHRIISLRELGRSDAPRLRVALDAAARSAAMNRDWPVSVSLLGLGLEVGHRGGEDLLNVETLLLRARIEARMGHASVAGADLMRARRAIDGLNDPAVRDRAEADRLAVEAALAPSPADAVPLLERAIEFHQVKGRRMHLPEMFLERGRALAALNKTTSAAADFEAGIRELEMQRQSIDAMDEQWATFAAADELFDEAVALAVARGDGAQAYAYAERAKSRELPGLMEGAAAVPLAADNDAVIVEYAALPAHLVIFVIERGHVRAVQTDVPRAVLSDEVEELTRSVTEQDSSRFRQAASVLYDRLLDPVAPQLSGRGTLVFVPDATLNTVPFSALLDRNGRFVVDDHAVVISPSAAVFARLAARSRSPQNATRHLLLIAGPSSRDGDLGRLTSAQREADAVAAAYGSGAEIASKGNDRAGFAARAARADVIHFVGHAVVPNGSEEAALVTSRDSGAAGRLEARDIAGMQLPRTTAVVLAACGTARGRARAGERNISVARAFLAAGVPSVVATLWPIEDGPASEFFPTFHRYLAKGLTPAEALRSTQLEWIHRRGAPPGMWAAVQIIGS